MRERPGWQFKPVKGIRKLHSVMATGPECKLLTRRLSCYCYACLHNDGENVEWVGEWETVTLEREAGGTTTRATNVEQDLDMALEMADLVARDSVVAIAADNSVYDYFLVKVTSNGVQILNDQTNGDYGSSFNKGSRVLYGNFFVRESLIDMTFKLDDTKTAIAFAATV